MIIINYAYYKGYRVCNIICFSQLISDFSDDVHENQFVLCFKIIFFYAIRNAWYKQF